MTNQTRQALLLSSDVDGEVALQTAGYNAEKLSKFFRRVDVPTRSSGYGVKLTLDSVRGHIRDFFSVESNVHILYGIFHGRAGEWKLRDGSLGLAQILELWDCAKAEGTAQYLLIVSDSCESGSMVEEVGRLARTDIAVQASCGACNDTSDVMGETFTELLLWNLQGRQASNIDSDKEQALLTFGPCYYCPDRSVYKGWIFIDEDGADQRSSESISLATESCDTDSPRSFLPEVVGTFSPRSLAPPFSNLEVTKNNGWTLARIAAWDGDLEVLEALSGDDEVLEALCFFRDMGLDLDNNYRCVRYLFESLRRRLVTSNDRNSDDSCDFRLFLQNQEIDFEDYINPLLPVCGIY
eukprot:Skav216958  [mRNA]  locus=scaffold2531:82668:83726:+ [translate_table: standard]